MDFNFAGILLAATVASGIIVLLDRLFWRTKRLELQSADPNLKEPILIEYARSFFPVLLFVLVLRSFLVEPFRIPSGSMEPTLNTGDFILVNKYAYGLRFPVTNNLFWVNNTPQRGDAVVFRFPVDPSINFIKRVIGVPGDQVVYKNKELFINGEKMNKELVESLNFIDSAGQSESVTEWTEDLFKHRHLTYQRDVPGRDVSVTVPEGHYFVMGDNRDDSDDSRSWGFVPDENLVGQAFAIWFSWDSNETNWLKKVRWERIGKKIE
ncbi:MAG: signal peptidase I [Gammaproteobacteria bacterium]